MQKYRMRRTYQAIPVTDEPTLAGYVRLLCEEDGLVHAVVPASDLESMFEKSTGSAASAANSTPKGA